MYIASYQVVPNVLHSYIIIQVLGEQDRAQVIHST